MPEGMRRAVFLGAVAAAVLFFRLGEARLWDRDEPRNARCAVEMLERHDWVVPMFNGELRSHKPVLLYWLIMTAYGLFGVNEFAARFWSAALGVGTVLCTYRMGCRLFHKRAGSCAALCLIPALMFNVACRAATPDALLVFLVTLAMLLFVEFDAGRIRFSLWQSFLFYGTLGLAVLAKGPVGLVLPLAIVLGYMWLERLVQRDPQATLISTGLQLVPTTLATARVMSGFALAMLVAVPWYAWVGYRTDGEFLTGFFWEHNVRRATETMENHSGSILLFYPATLLVGFFPASIFAIPTGLTVFKSLREQRPGWQSLLFCVMWVAVFVGLFSLASTKLPSYVTPCYPALALLTGFTLSGLLEQRALIPAWWPGVSYACMGLAGAIVMPVIYFVAQRHLPGSESIALVGLPLVAGGAIALGLLLREQNRSAMGVAAGGGILFTASLFGMGSVAADAHQQQHLLFAPLHARTGETELASWNCLESSWVFYFGKPISELPHGNSAEGVNRIGDYLGRGDGHFVILRQSDWERMQGELVTSASVVSQAPYFLKNEGLVMIGPKLHEEVAQRP